MSRLVAIITAADPAHRDTALTAAVRDLSLTALLAEAEALEAFRRTSPNLYERVRALFFLYALHRFEIPRHVPGAHGRIPYVGQVHLLQRRFEEAIRLFLGAQREQGPSGALSSALAEAYHKLGFQTLADQVRQSVRSVRGNQWMFRVGHPDEQPLRVRPELLTGEVILREATAVRMDLSHSAWSDIFFLGMDFPEGARVLNVSIDLAVRGRSPRGPQPPVEAYLRVIDEPVLRLVSLDLKASSDLHSVSEVFDYARDYLGLLKGAVIAAGLVPPGLEGAGGPITAVLEPLVGPGRGLEVVSRVNDIPKGSRLAVSTNLLACLITVCMRATCQTQALTGSLTEDERRLVAARAILGEWLAGSGGGWQDSGGVWPDMKLIAGVQAAAGDPEHGISRGRLLPGHHIFSPDEITPATRQALQDSLVLVHGGMAQNVGPILEQVTEKYLLRGEVEWAARQDAIALFDEIVAILRAGGPDCIRQLGAATTRNFFGPIQAIIPRATTLYTETLIDRVRAEFGADFWGFWMLGGASGGGMGFMVAPSRREQAKDRLAAIMSATKRDLEHALPFAMEPVVYDFAINTRGTWGEQVAGGLMPASYYQLMLPDLLRRDALSLSPGRRAELDRFGAASRTQPDLAELVPALFERLLPRGNGAGTSTQTLDQVLEALGFDRLQHELIRRDLRDGRIGLAQNRLPASTVIEDADSVPCATELLDADVLRQAGERLLAEGGVAVVSLAAGVGSRWTEGAGVVKAINPFTKLGGGQQRTFLEIHLAKSRKTGEQAGAYPAHVITTSYLTDGPIRAFLTRERNYGYPGPLVLSAGRSVGLRLIPMARDLRFAWEELPQQVLDERKQRMRESAHQALIGWARAMGEGTDYRDNVPEQCLHPVGHWYEIPNLLRNGTLVSLLRERPALSTLLLHNIDTVGAHLDPVLLGWHLRSGVTLTNEVIGRWVDDRGGGLARVDGQLRLLEGLAMPREEDEAKLSYYNTGTYWIAIDGLLAAFGLARNDLDQPERVDEAVRALAVRMPTYVTLKDVKKRWGNGQEDVYPVAQFEKLWGDMTALPDLACAYVEVPRARGLNLKDVAQLDGWLRDGSAAYVASLCSF